MKKTTAPLYLGFDTGGTYTDAVLFCEERGVVASAKALTTRHDLSVGIAEAARKALREVARRDIALVSMSTTLATNALVEGQGGAVALVMVGFGPGELKRDGLGAALGRDPVIFVPGGHDVHGNETPLDLAPLKAVLGEVAPQVTGFAVCACFAMRNPAHELSVAALLREATGLPVTMSHELSPRLGGPRRALTTVLNARLVAMIGRLVAATEAFLAEEGIEAPLMVVRGDGALVSAHYARARPIETILSGPAASIVGARYLTGLDDAMVADIGGTTTDIAVLAGGRPRIDPGGAVVGGHRTMVEAVAIRTYGLGGDSEVALADDGPTPRIRLGPRRLVPLSLLAALHGEDVTRELERQAGRQLRGRLDGRFVLRTGLPGHMAAGLSASEARLFARIAARPVPVETVLAGSSDGVVLERLAARGLVQVAGFTPSDAAHVLGLQETWSQEAAVLGAELFARRRDRAGRLIAEDAQGVSRAVLDALKRRSAEIVYETALCEDGLDPALVANPLFARALAGAAGHVRLAAALDRPMIGLGASAGLHYRGLEERLGQPCHVPAHAEVANAVGAVVGQVRVTVSATVTQPVEGVFRVSAGETIYDFASSAEAIEAARRRLHVLAGEAARAAGTDEAAVEIACDLSQSEVEGRAIFLEAALRATATGRPRIAA